MKNFILFFSLFITSFAFAQPTLISDEYPGLHIKSSNSQAVFNGEQGEKWRIGCTAAPGDDFLFYDRANNINRMIIDDETGFIGIGTNSPSNNLTVNGSIGTSELFQNVATFNSFSGERLWSFQLSSQQNDFILYDLSASLNRFVVQAGTGYVGIGSSNPDSELTVKGIIHCEEVLVDLQVPGPDYVFEKYYEGFSELKADYEMPSLEEVEAFTKANHHLPNVPSAQQMQEEGIELKEMSTILLQKIEELTLYTIEQEKRIEALETQLAEKE